MSLAKRLQEARPSRTGLPCSIGVLLDSLNKSEAAALLAALQVPKGDPRRLSARVIAEALRLEGHDVGDRSIVNHRNGACRCDYSGTIDS